MAQFRVVIAENYGRAVDRLREIADVMCLDSCDESAILKAVADADALLVRSYAIVNARVLDSAPHLKVIGRGGAGLDNIDVATAKRRGIVVVHTPAAATQSVAEHTLGMMLALERQWVESDRAVREGRFAEFRSRVRFRQLSDLTLGIVGMGRIGSAVAKTAHDGFKMNVVYNDILAVGPFSYATSIKQKSDLYEIADIVSLHVPLTDETRGLIDADALKHFRPTTTLINTSRGAVVDLVALAKALSEHRIAGAALDVFEQEPPPPSHPILNCPNVLLSPHAAARTANALARMDGVVDDVIRVLQGEKPHFPA